MKDFLAKMSFPRAVILFCSFGSLALGVLVYMRSERLSEVQRELRQVPELIRDLHTDAYRLSHLQHNASNENLKAQAEPESYIRGVAADKKISLGQVDIGTMTRTPAANVEDAIYKITPKTKTMRYTRGQIGNFLYKLEADSRRVKVTRIKLTPYDKTAPGEISKDSWVFEIDLTTRTKLESAPAAAPKG